MAKSKWWPWLIAVVCVLISVAFTMRSCHVDAKYAKAKADYEEARRIAEADHALSLGHIAQLDKEIGQRDKTIGELNGDIALKNERIKVLLKDLADLQNSEPPTTPEIEALPIVINLRGQVAKLTGMFTLATATINDKDKVIAEWTGKFDAQVKISAEWKSAYDREHTLRVQAEALFKLGEHRTGLNKLIRNVALGVAGAGVIYGLLK